jgi:hypothetical protein
MLPLSNLQIPRLTAGGENWGWISRSRDDQAAFPYRLTAISMRIGAVLLAITLPNGQTGRLVAMTERPLFLFPHHPITPRNHFRAFQSLRCL